MKNEINKAIPKNWTVIACKSKSVNKVQVNSQLSVASNVKN